MKHTPSIAIYFDNPEKLGYPLNHTIYFQSYIWFSEYAEKRGVNIYIVRGDSYQGNMIFKEGYQFKNRDLVWIKGPIKVDLIYIKGTGQPPKTTAQDCIVNDPKLDKFCGDKEKTYAAFNQFMAKTSRITPKNWREVIANIRTKKVVLKPVHGSSGTGILILDKKKVDFPSYKFKEPYLAQEFVDTSKGYPGLVQQPHDLRVIIFNGKPKLAYFRLAKAGVLLSNIAQGASARAIDASEIPVEVLKIVKEVDRHFEHYNPRIYTIDFLLEGRKAYLGELNRRPGFPHPVNEGQKFCTEFYQYLLDTLLEGIKKRAQSSPAR